MTVITIEESAFYELFNKLAEEMKRKYGNQVLDKWIDGAEAMALMRITSKTTLQKLRDTGAIRYSQPEKKIILYDRDSIYAYIEKHVREIF